MNIIFFIGSLTGGGAEHQCLLKAKKIAEKNTQVTIFTLTKLNKLNLDNEALKIISLCNLNEGNKINKIISVIKAILCLRKYIKSLNGKVILYAWLEVPQFISFWSVLFTDAKLIWAIRNSNMGVHKYYWKMNAVIKLNRFFSGRVDAFVANSCCGLNFYKNKLHYKIKKDLVLANSINLTHDSFYSSRVELREKLKIEEGRFVVVSVSRLSPIKNVENMLFAVANVHKKKPDFLQYLIVGSGEPGYVSQLNKLVKELEIEHIVKFTGEIRKASAVEKYMQAADLFISASLSEGLSNSLLEAMANQVLCLSTDVGDANIFLPHENIISGFDSAAIAEKISWALSLNQIKRKEIIEKSYKNIASYCDPDRNTKKALAFFNDI